MVLPTGQPSLIQTSNTASNAPLNDHRSSSADTASGTPVAAKKKSQKEMTRAERRELQERQKAEKKARQGTGNAPRKETKPSSGQPKSQNQLATVTASPLASTHGSVNELGHRPSNSPGIRTPAQMRFDDPKMRQKIQQSDQRTPAQKPVALFSHLIQYEKKSNFSTQENIHPAVLNLGLQYSEFTIAGGNARCIAMLNVFKKVIQDYVTPPGITLQRHLTTYLSKQIDFLKSTRVLAASMKSAIRALKYEISILSIDIPDADAKKHLCEEIDCYIRNKISVADDAIILHTLRYIYDGDVILTFSRSSVVLGVLLAAQRKGINFRVIICDARPKLEGQEMLRGLVNAGIKCTYILSNALGAIIKEVTKVVIGASSVLSNGAVMSRTGTAMVSMMAHDHQIPVIVCCETYKFSDQVLLDSFVWNEIGDPDELLDISNRCPSQRLPSVVASTFHNGNQETVSTVLKDWRDVDGLRLLNLHYDITPAHFLTVVCCDIGVIAPTSVVTVMRDIHQQKH